MARSIASDCSPRRFRFCFAFFSLADVRRAYSGWLAQRTSFLVVSHIFFPRLRFSTPFNGIRPLDGESLVSFRCARRQSGSSQVCESIDCIGLRKTASVNRSAPLFKDEPLCVEQRRVRCESVIQRHLVPGIGTAFLVLASCFAIYRHRFKLKQFQFSR